MNREEFIAAMEHIYLEVAKSGYRVDGLSLMFKISNEKDNGTLTSRSRLNCAEYIGMLTTELEKVKSESLSKAMQHEVLEAFSKIKAMFEKQECIQH